MSSSTHKKPHHSPKEIKSLGWFSCEELLDEQQQWLEEHLERLSGLEKKIKKLKS